MVTDFSHADFQIKISKTGHAIPVVNDVHLHSIYNPIKEAEAFLEKNKIVIKQKNKVLILGLGFAYHVNLVVKLMEENFQNDFEIAVIEPHLEMAKDCLTRNFINDERVTIYSKAMASDLYKIDEFINFLMKGPNILTHSASFNLHERFFRDLLSYRAPTDVESISKRIRNKDLQNYLGKLQPQNDLYKFIHEDIKKKVKADCAEDYLLLAFAGMTKVKSTEEASI